MRKFLMRVLLGHALIDWIFMFCLCGMLMLYVFALFMGVLFVAAQ